MLSHAPRLQSTLLSCDGFEGNCTLSLSNTSCTIFSIFKLEAESVEFHVYMKTEGGRVSILESVLPC